VQQQVYLNPQSYLTNFFKNNNTTPIQKPCVDNFNKLSLLDTQDIKNLLKKNLKKQIEDGSIKINHLDKTLGKFHLGPRNTNDLDTLVSNNKLRRAFFKKNTKLPTSIELTG
jgi:hypothetical protein